jgi:hypothetical protein
MILVKLLEVNPCIYKIISQMIYKVKDHLDQINLKIEIYNGSLDQLLVY